MTVAITVADALDGAARTLAAAGIDGGRREARLLLAHALAVRMESLIADPARPVDSSSRDRFTTLIERRARREPMSHLLGVREFWSLDFAVTADVLDPRPDSETLVAAALDCFPDRDAPLAVLDLGTGSGCLLLAVLSERPVARGLGVDASQEALAVAEANARRLRLIERVRFRQGDWDTGVGGRFDLILCNPPYIPTSDIAALDREVSCYEPRLALDGGADGLVAYRRIVPQFKRLLSDRDGARAVIEVGAGQAEPVTSIMIDAGLVITRVHRDLSGVERCIVAGVAVPFTKP